MPKKSTTTDTNIIERVINNPESTHGSTVSKGVAKAILTLRDRYLSDNTEDGIKSFCTKVDDI